MAGSVGICCGRARIGGGSSILTPGDHAEIGSGHPVVVGFKKDLYRSGKG
jgi:hypothetical protein